MKRGRSTGTPTKEEAAYIVACKEGPCMACDVLRERGQSVGCDGLGCDFHHMKSGNIRRGHMFGVGLDTWHHRGHPLPGYTAKQMREQYGPSLMDGGKAFTAAFGSDEELLQRQKNWLGGDDE